MTRLLSLPTLSLTLVGLLALPSLGQTKPKPTAKPKPARPVPQTGGPIVQGTLQLPGDFGRLGTTYTLGRTQPLNVTLRRAEYSLGRELVPYLDEFHWIAPPPGKKWLKLHLTLQNPTQADSRVWYQALHLTAVHADDTNHEAALFTPFVRESDSDSFIPAPLDQRLLPGQRLDVTYTLAVPAAGPIVKLVIERERGLPVVRYDLHERITPLSEGTADPADPTRATAKERFTVQSDKRSTQWLYELGITRLEWLDEAPDPDVPPAPPAGKRFLGVQLWLQGTGARERHTGPAGIAVRGSTVRGNVTLTLDDGQELAIEAGFGAGGLYSPLRRGHLELAPERNQTLIGRVYFAVPSGATPTQLTVRLPDSRPVTYLLTPKLFRASGGGS